LGGTQGPGGLEFGLPNLGRVKPLNLFWGTQKRGLSLMFPIRKRIILPRRLWKQLSPRLFGKGGLVPQGRLGIPQDFPFSIYPSFAFKVT